MIGCRKLYYTMLSSALLQVWPQLSQILDTHGGGKMQLMQVRSCLGINIPIKSVTHVVEMFKKVASV